MPYKKCFAHLSKEEMYERKKELARDRFREKRKQEKELILENKLYKEANLRKAKEIIELKQEITRLKHGNSMDEADNPVIDKDECPYCLEKCDVVLSCGHRGHVACIRKNHIELRQKRVCAICKAPPSPQDRQMLGLNIRV